MRAQREALGWGKCWLQRCLAGFLKYPRISIWFFRCIWHLFIASSKLFSDVGVCPPVSPSSMAGCVPPYQTLLDVANSVDLKDPMWGAQSWVPAWGNMWHWWPMDDSRVDPMVLSLATYLQRLIMLIRGRAMDESWWANEWWEFTHAVMSIIMTIFCDWRILTVRV